MESSPSTSSLMKYWFSIESFPSCNPKTSLQLKLKANQLLRRYFEEVLWEKQGKGISSFFWGGGKIFSMEGRWIAKRKSTISAEKLKNLKLKKKRSQIWFQSQFFTLLKWWRKIWHVTRWWSLVESFWVSFNLSRHFFTWSTGIVKKPCFVYFRMHFWKKRRNNVKSNDLAKCL